MNEAHVSRRGFLSAAATSAVGAGFALALPSEILSQSAPQVPAKPPRLSLDMVQEFVRFGLRFGSHQSLARPGVRPAQRHLGLGRRRLGNRPRRSRSHGPQRHRAVPDFQRRPHGHFPRRHAWKAGHPQAHAHRLSESRCFQRPPRHHFNGARPKRRRRSRRRRPLPGISFPASLKYIRARLANTVAGDSTSFNYAAAKPHQA